jgi:2-polyprenyl-6-methoxyphenol hydroxylase-like FAD-dependent oxidoreductase/predicted DsbA family dithiol-disulfide isomerase
MPEYKPLLQKIKVIYFSDPVCSTCWIMDPYIKKLISDYQIVIDLDMVMGGLLESWDNFCGGRVEETQTFLCDLWKDEAKKYNIHLDHSVWLKKPISSSTPASVAYYAAENQGMEIAQKFLRNLREQLFLRGKDISEKRHLITAAVDSGLNLDRFLHDLDNGFAATEFKKRLDDKTIWQVDHYPTLIFVNEEGEVEKGMDPVGNFSPQEMFNDWERILDKLTKGDSRKLVRTKTVSEVLKQYERLSFYELSVLTGLNERILTQQIEVLYREGMLVKEKHGNVNYYRSNNTSFFFKKDGFLFNNPTVIGAGVCGRYVSKVLSLFNVEPLVLERQKPDAFKGFGFIILKNGIDALDAVGLKNELLKESNSINFFKAVDPNGNILFEKLLDNCLAITREGFYKVIDESMPTFKVNFQEEAVDLIHGENNKLKGLKLSNDEVLHSEIFFATDGIRSKMRTSIYPDRHLEVLTEREIVGSAYLPELDIAKDEFLKVIDIENGKNMGILPLGDGNFIWFLQLNMETSPVEDNSPEGLQKYVEETTKNFPEAFQLLAKYSDFSKAFLWTANRMDLLPSFHHQQLVLLGDAAHPLLAFTSQGANSALEDAAYLLSMLSFQQYDDPVEDIFEQYYEMRKDAIAHHIKEGDSLLEHFLNMKKNPHFKLPLSVH